VKVEAVVFDLGGVLLEVDFGEVFAAWGRSAGIPAATLRQRFRLDEAYEQHERGEIDATAYFATLRESLSLDLTDEQFAQGWMECVRGEIPGVAGLIAQFESRLPIYVFSNSNVAHYLDWGPRYRGLLQSFRRVFLSFEMGLRKPEARAFEFIAAEIGVSLPNILFFDDTEENVLGARALGMQAVHVHGNEDLRSALAGLNP
jgi:epoxide hydrolase-like predicted phosphatase